MKSIVENTDVTTTMTSEDAILIMECQMALDEKIDTIITHLGL